MVDCCPLHASGSPLHDVSCESWVDPCKAGFVHETVAGFPCDHKLEALGCPRCHTTRAAYCRSCAVCTVCGAGPGDLVECGTNAIDAVLGDDPTTHDVFRAVSAMPRVCGDVLIDSRGVFHACTNHSGHGPYHFSITGTIEWADDSPRRKVMRERPPRYFTTEERRRVVENLGRGHDVESGGLCFAHGMTNGFTDGDGLPLLASERICGREGCTNKRPLTPPPGRGRQ